LSAVLVIAAVLMLSASPGYSDGNGCGCSEFSGYGYYGGNYGYQGGGWYPCRNGVWIYPYFYNPFYNE
jgi:hypothetical protein